MACDCEGVGSQGGLHLRVIEVDHCPLVCEHVHLQWNTEGIDRLACAPFFHIISRYESVNSGSYSVEEYKVTQGEKNTCKGQAKGQRKH